MSYSNFLIFLRFYENEILEVSAQRGIGSKTMRVRLVLLAAALLLGGGALYFWQAGWPSPSWIEAGKAAPGQRVAAGVRAKPRSSGRAHRSRLSFR